MSEAPQITESERAMLEARLLAIYRESVTRFMLASSFGDALQQTMLLKLEGDAIIAALNGQRPDPVTVALLIQQRNARQSKENPEGGTSG